MNKYNGSMLPRKHHQLLPSTIGEKYFRTLYQYYLIKKKTIHWHLLTASYIPDDVNISHAPHNSACLPYFY